MDFVTSKNFRGLALVKKLAKENPSIVPSGIDLNNPISYTPNVEEIEKLASSLFADRVFREYPINNAVNTWLSAVHFYTDGQTKTASVKGSAENIETSIQLAAEAYGIGEVVDNLVDSIVDYANLSNNTKVAGEQAETKKYAYTTIDEETNDEINYLPISSFEEIKKTAAELSAKRAEIPQMIFKVASENILNAYNKLPEKIRSTFKLPESIKVAGERYIIDSAKLQNLADSRYQKTNDQAYLEISKQASEDAASNEDYKVALASICELDIKHDIYKDYDKTILNPYTEASSNITEEEAIKMAKELVTVTDELIVPLEIFKKASVKEGLEAICSSKEVSDKLISAIDSNDAIKVSSVIEKLHKSDVHAITEVLVARG
jgi:hypothetical protein